VKAFKEASIDIRGNGFECFDAECSDLKCRFGNSKDHYIYVQGEFISGESIRCKVPEYTKPDVLQVEVTVNGESYTSDGMTYGYFDPFVLDAQPRLIATDGSTNVAIDGIGFVDSGQIKSLFSKKNRQLQCKDSERNMCTKAASF